MIEPDFALSRRSLGLAVGVAALISAMPAALAQKGGDVAVAELMKKTPLQELSIGSPDAKVTVVEYASLTCPSCQNFHLNVLPGLKTKYIDTGKVRLILRIWPRDTRDAAGYMLALCAGGEKSYPLVSALFQRQREWAFIEGSPTEKLLEIAKQVGFTKETFEKCLTNQKLLDDITTERDRATKDFVIEATPTFFINGKRLSDWRTADFEKALDAQLKGT